MKTQRIRLLMVACSLACGFQAGQVACSAPRDFDTVKVEPESELAHWYSGQVYFDSQWRTIEEVQQLVSTDLRWREYRQRAERLDDSPKSHAELADWCQRKGLDHEAKLHWFYVLQAIPDHPGARKGLGLTLYRGQLYPFEQVAAMKREAKVVERELLKHKPRLMRLRRVAQLGSETARESALEQLASVSDPAAIPALVAVAQLQFGRADSPPNRIVGEGESPFELLLQQSAVTALSNMSSHEATLKLLEIAVLSPYVSLRKSAAEALVPREKTSYMPLLMECLAEPLEADIDIRVSPNGMVMLSEEIIEVGPEAEQVATRFSDYFITTYYLRQDVVQRNFQGDMRKALARAQQTQHYVDATNSSRELWNDRISEILLITTGRTGGSDPRQWWDYWKDYNEMYYPEETPIYRTSTYDDFIEHRTAPSCFVAGTPVWTLAGPAPIESIREGDLVLSQNPLTGCLDYRPVLQTTTRPPSPTVAVSLDDETIVATRGHRFWVMGEGWRMAKHLTRGDQLHGARAVAELRAADETAEQEAYNLIVGEFHTYFVGNSKLLVHDNGCPLPTEAVAPGIEPVVE